MKLATRKNRFKWSKVYGIHRWRESGRTTPVKRRTKGGGSQTCSAKCRVKLSRSKRTTEQVAAERARDAERIRNKRQAVA